MMIKEDVGGLAMNTTKKRNLFEEIKQGIQEINDYKVEKITLRTQKIEKKPRLTISPAIILDTREKFHMSRTVFAIKLGTSARTLEKWEQGKVVPNDQATALILMIRKYPDTLKRLEDIRG
jgi:putative transcriptional regulator